MSIDSIADCTELSTGGLLCIASSRTLCDNFHNIYTPINMPIITNNMKSNTSINTISVLFIMCEFCNLIDKQIARSNIDLCHKHGNLFDKINQRIVNLENTAETAVDLYRQSLKTSQEYEWTNKELKRELSEMQLRHNTIKTQIQNLFVSYSNDKSFAVAKIRFFDEFCLKYV